MGNFFTPGDIVKFAKNAAPAFPLFAIRNGNLADTLFYIDDLDTQFLVINVIVGTHVKTAQGAEKILTVIEFGTTQRGSHFARWFVRA